jgi:pentatricopeptide repeat protein
MRPLMAALTSCVERGDLAGAQRVLSTIEASPTPCPQAYGTYLRGVAMLGGASAAARELLARRAQGLAVDLHAYHVVLRALAESGDCEAALSLIDQCVVSAPGVRAVPFNVNSYNLVLFGFVHRRQFVEIERLLALMERRGIRPNATTLVLRIVAHVADGSFDEAVRMYTRHAPEFGLRELGMLVRHFGHHRLAGLLGDVLARAQRLGGGGGGGGGDGGSATAATRPSPLLLSIRVRAELTAGRAGAAADLVLAAAAAASALGAAESPDIAQLSTTDVTSLVRELLRTDQPERARVLIDAVSGSRTLRELAMLHGRVMRYFARVGNRHAIDQGYAALEKLGDDAQRLALPELFSAYCVCEDMSAAERVLQAVRERGHIIPRRLLDEALGELSLKESATAQSFVDVLRTMQAADVSPSIDSYLTFLSFLVARGKTSLAFRVVQQELAHSEFARDPRVYATLVDGLIKRSDHLEAELLLSQLHDSGIHVGHQPYDKLIHGYERCGKGDRALVLYETMLARGIHPSTVTSSRVLGALVERNDVGKAQQVFARVPEAVRLVEPLPRTMMALYQRNGLLREAEQLLLTASSDLRGAVGEGSDGADVDVGVSVGVGVDPSGDSVLQALRPGSPLASLDERTWLSYGQLLLAGGQEERLHALVERVHECGMPRGRLLALVVVHSAASDPGASKALVHAALSRLGTSGDGSALPSEGRAVALLDAASDASVGASASASASANATALTRAPAGVGPGQGVDAREANLFLEQMLRFVKDGSLIHDPASASQLIAAAWSAFRVHRLSPSFENYRFLVHALVKCNLVDKAEQTLQLIQQAGLRCDEDVYNVVLAGHARAGRVADAERVMRRMRKEGIDISSRTVSIMFPAWCRTGNTKRALAFYRAMQPASNDVRVCALTSLVIGLGRVGMGEEALTLWEAELDSGLQPDVALYTTVIDQYFRAHDLEGALGTYRHMRERQMWPSPRTVHLTLSNVLQQVHDGEQVRAHIDELVQTAVRHPVSFSMADLEEMARIIATRAPVEVAARVALDGTLPFSIASMAKLIERAGEHRRADIARALRLHSADNHLRAASAAERASAMSS